MNREALMLVTFISFLPIVSKTQTIPEHTITVAAPTSVGFYFFVPAIVNLNDPRLCWPHIILDKNGKIVYSKIFPKESRTIDFKLQSNGFISYFMNKKHFLMDSSFSVIDSVYLQNGLSFDTHDLLILPNGNYVLLGNEIVNPNDIATYYVDTNSVTIPIKRKVKCGVIQEQDPHRNVVFEWHSKDYFDFRDIDPKLLKDSTVYDWMHFNSIEADLDGNYIISIRYFNEVTKVNRGDSSIMWRLGGKHNQFTFENDSIPFLGQHDIRRLANGHITLFDNGWSGSTHHAASAREYEINEKTHRAKLVWSYVDNPIASSKHFGSMQRLPNGNTLVNYGFTPKSRTLFNVVEPSGKKIFEVVFKDTIGSYRVYNYADLPWKIPTPVITSYCVNGKVVLDAGKGHRTYLWSTGEKTQVIQIKTKGIYSVSVPLDSGGFTSNYFEVKKMKSSCRGAKKVN